MSDITSPSLQVVIGPNPPDRLDKALARDVPEEASLSRSRLAKLLAEGAISRDGQPLSDAKARVAEGEVYDIILGPAEEVDTRPEDIPLNVIWDDPDLIVIDKPAGMVVHPAPGSYSGTLGQCIAAPLWRHTFRRRWRTAPGNRSPDRQGHNRSAGGG